MCFLLLSSYEWIHTAQLEFNIFPFKIRAKSVKLVFKNWPQNFPIYCISGFICWVGNVRFLVDKENWPKNESAKIPIWICAKELSVKILSYFFFKYLLNTPTTKVAWYAIYYMGTTMQPKKKKWRCCITRKKCFLKYCSAIFAKCVVHKLRNYGCRHVIVDQRHIYL